LIPIVVHISFSWVEIDLHARFQLPRLPKLSDVLWFEKKKKNKLPP
jgi:hypothetical protein